MSNFKSINTLITISVFKIEKIYLSNIFMRHFIEENFKCYWQFKKQTQMNGYKNIYLRLC